MDFQCDDNYSANEYTLNIDFLEMAAEMAASVIDDFDDIFDDIPMITEDEVMTYIKKCEQAYSMTTKEFLQLFADEGYEGNVELQLWAQYAEGLGLNG